MEAWLERNFDQVLRQVTLLKKRFINPLTTFSSESIPPTLSHPEVIFDVPVIVYSAFYFQWTTKM